MPTLSLNDPSEIIALNEPIIEGEGWVSRAPGGAKRAPRSKPESLTAKYLASLSPPDGRGEIWRWDKVEKGLGVRVRAGRKMAWMLRYTFQGVQRQASIGNPAEVPVEEARARAADIKASARKGVDALAAKHEARVAPIIGELITNYLKAVQGSLSPAYYRDVSLNLKDYANPLHSKKQVTRAEAAKIIANIRRGDDKNRPRPAQAKSLQSSLSAFFAWAINEGQYSGESPVRGMKTIKVAARDRVLTAYEINVLWRATESARDAHKIIRLLLLTGQREGEVGGMRWSEISTAGGIATWTIPSSRTKNKRRHVVPMTPLALAHLPPRPESLFDDAGVERPVFGIRKASDSNRKRKEIKVRTTGKIGFSGWSKVKRELDDRMGEIMREDFVKAHGRAPRAGEAVLEPWRLHDLRRTFATHIGEAGVEPFLIEALLNDVTP
jgi:integrase